MQRAVPNPMLHEEPERPRHARQQLDRAALLAPATRSSQWLLMTGAAGLPLVRHAGQALLLSSISVAWLWALAAVDALWPVVVALFFSGHVWRLWRDWQRPPEPLLLCWVARQDGGRVADATTAGWQVPAWGAGPVTVRSVWDGQSAVLLHLNGKHQAWVWLRDDGGRDAHRLRTLIALPTPPVGGVTSPKRPWHDPS